MTELLLAALCSVLVSLVLKWSKSQGFTAIALISWNYVAAIGLSAVLLKPNFSSLQHINSGSWLAFLALGLLLPVIFVTLARSLHHAGLIKTEVAQRMSLVLSLLAAFLLFAESFNWLKLLGIVLGLGGVLGLILSSKGSSKSVGALKHSGGLLLAVWAGYAAVDVLLKYISTLGYSTSIALCASFGIALLGLCLWQAIQRQWKPLLQPRHIGLGLMLGTLNFCNIWFYIKAHQQLASNPAIVFASMNILVVVLGVVAGVVLFREKLKKSGWGFVALSLMAIVLLYYARI